MPHLSELHGASTHLAVVAIPVFAILHFVRRAACGVRRAACRVIGVSVQGYLGGRMTSHHGVGVADRGEFSQTATGAEQLALALASGTDQATAGRRAFSTTGCRIRGGTSAVVT